MIEDLIKQNRSYRRFHQEHPVDLATLRSSAPTAAFATGAMNRMYIMYPSVNWRILSSGSMAHEYFLTPYS